MAIPEKQITSEIHAWLDRRRVISDAVALELFAQYRGSSESPFSGVSGAGILTDAEGLLGDIAEVTDSLGLTGSIPRFEELAALAGWVHGWQNTHVVDGDDVYEILPVREG